MDIEGGLPRGSKTAIFLPFEVLRIGMIYSFFSSGMYLYWPVVTVEK
jgi:hypothetical protein